MNATDYLKEQGIHPSEPIYWYGDDDVITLEQLLESYHEAKLKLLGIGDVVGRSEQFKCAMQLSKSGKRCDKQCVECELSYTNYSI